MVVSGTGAANVDTFQRSAHVSGKRNSNATNNGTVKLLPYYDAAVSVCFGSGNMSCLTTFHVVFQLCVVE